MSYRYLIISFRDACFDYKYRSTPHNFEILETSNKEDAINMLVKSYVLRQQERVPVDPYVRERYAERETFFYVNGCNVESESYCLDEEDFIFHGQEILDDVYSKVNEKVKLMIEAEENRIKQEKEKEEEEERKLDMIRFEELRKKLFPEDVEKV